MINDFPERKDIIDYVKKTLPAYTSQEFSNAYIDMIENWYGLHRICKYHKDTFKIHDVVDLGIKIYYLLQSLDKLSQKSETHERQAHPSFL